jgi:NIPSNAP
MSDRHRRTAFCVAAMALAMVGQASPDSIRATPPEGPAARRAVEIRSYNLKPGTRDEFHRLAAEVAVPMLRRWKVDVVAHGPSAHDANSYYLIRSFPSLPERERSEEAFYGSDEWRQGPRDAVLALIDSYVTVVLELDAAAVEALRRP